MKDTRRKGGEVTASGTNAINETRQEMDVSEETKRPEFGGWQAVAEALTAAGYGDVSRQAVYGWWRRRDKTGFPEVVRVDGRRKLRLAEVMEWRRAYVPNKGGRPRKQEG